VLALLVLLCAGVISFLLNQNTAMGGSGSPAAVVQAGAPLASYRFPKQAAAPLSLNRATEGRQTL
jgi:serine/threonine-protein kinase